MLSTTAVTTLFAMAKAPGTGNASGCDFSEPDVLLLLCGVLGTVCFSWHRFWSAAWDYRRR